MKACPSSFVRVFSKLALLVAVAAAAESVAAKPGYLIKPAPPWIKQINVEPGRGNRELASSILLEDQETKLTFNNVERFYRHVERVNKVGGLESVSQLRFYFEPSYQSLSIHFIRITRGDQTTDALASSEIKLIQKEDELDEQIYNGTMAAVVFLNDVRVGDVVDYAFTVSGDNPVFAGRYAERYYLASNQPIQINQVRLISPVNRTMYVRNNGTDQQPKISQIAGDTEYLWERQDIPAVESDDFTPSWFDPIPSVQVSEFPDWQSVVQWALPLYQIEEPLAAELKIKTEVWMKQFPEPERRMIAALRYIQQEIRYLGIELGPYSHRPNPPSRTMSRRFGDCKDKSLLLAAVLVHLGFDCDVALVNTSAKHSLDTWPPSPHAFDHVIVRARVAGKTYWLDPTLESQRGGIEQYYDPAYERALVLRADTRELETLPRPVATSPLTSIEEHYIIKHAAAPVSLRVTSTYRGVDADIARSRWSQSSASEMGKTFLNYYAETNPSIRADALPEIRDDEDSNTIVITERYSIDSFWKDQSHYFNGNLVYDELSKPRVSQRSMPLAISHPTFTTQTIEIESSSPLSLEPTNETIIDGAFRFEHRRHVTGNSLRLTYSVQTLRDHVPANEVTTYLERTDRIWNSMGLQFAQNSTVLGSRSRGTRGVSAITTILLVLGATVGFILLIKSRIGIRPLKWNRENKPAPGASPATAVRCRRDEEIEALARQFRCNCGSNPFKPDDLAHQETLLYDDEKLGTFKMKCQACSRVSDWYFVKPRLDEALNAGTPTQNER